jgi:hypothetical protein
MKMDWVKFALKVPAVIAGAVQVMQQISAPGADKKKAVVDSLPTAIELVEFAAGKDVLNDPAVLQLVHAAVDAEAAAIKAREALKAGILAKAPVPNGV